MFYQKRLSEEEMEKAMKKIKEIISSYPVVVFSKANCVYCEMVKELLTQLGATFEVLELNEMSDGGEIQSAVLDWTNRDTIPRVFINGKHFGGCDKMNETHAQGKLVPLLTEAGALAKISSKL